MKHVPLGEVLTLDVDAVELEPLQSYQIAGVYSFGRGMFRREALTGTTTSYRRLNRLHEGCLVMSRLKAFEGAVAIVPRELNGYFVSQEFPTFALDESRVTRRYFALICRWRGFWERLARASRGVGARRERVHPEQLLSLTIPLPKLAEQQRIAAYAEAVLQRASHLATKVDEAARLDQAMLEAFVERILAGDGTRAFPGIRLEEVAVVNPRPAKVDGLVAFVPMRTVDDRLGRIVDPELLPADEVKSGYKQFRRGDVIFARITPCMQNGKSALMDVNGVEYGYGSTEFHVLRPSEALKPEWLHHVVRSRGFRERAAQAFTGTAGQQRVPADFLRSGEIPVPSIDTQAALVARLDHVVRLGHELRAKRERQQRRAQALMSSTLNEVFSSAA
jgi:type I restriction enzyme, S subunit